VVLVSGWFVVVYDPDVDQYLWHRLEPVVDDSISSPVQSAPPLSHTQQTIPPDSPETTSQSAPPPPSSAADPTPPSATPPAPSSTDGTSPPPPPAAPANGDSDGNDGPPPSIDSASPESSNAAYIGLMVLSAIVTALFLLLAKFGIDEAILSRLYRNSAITAVIAFGIVILGVFVTLAAPQLPKGISWRKWTIGVPPFLRTPSVCGEAARRESECLLRTRRSSVAGRSSSLARSMRTATVSIRSLGWLGT
jgi:hypothetical protein